MGMGDEIMVTGEVNRLVKTRKVQRVAIFDQIKTKFRWSDIWQGHPHIARPGEGFDHALANGPGVRPYIKAKTPTQWTWRDYGPPVGSIYLTPAEREFGKELNGAVLIQPWSKPSASPNKKWPQQYWQQLVDSNPHVKWVQVGHTMDQLLRNVYRFVFTPDFRSACGALAGARAAVLQEGGLHHAAAALGTPAVVVFGGFISPAVTGYNTQRNLFVESEGHRLGCGMRVPCMHCEEAMRSITPGDVMRQLEEVL